MNVKPTDDQVKAIARLTRNADWQVLEEWLQTNREACVKASLSSDGVQCRQAQGMLMAIDSFVRNTRAAEELASSR